MLEALSPGMDLRAVYGATMAEYLNRTWKISHG
jgi:hypothetical protein